MKLVKIAYGNDEDQKSFTETQGLLQAYPNLKGIISRRCRYCRGCALHFHQPLQGQGCSHGFRNTQPTPPIC